jgi:hypothetical protein
MALTMAKSILADVPPILISTFLVMSSLLGEIGLLFVYTLVAVIASRLYQRLSVRAKRGRLTVPGRRSIGIRTAPLAMRSLRGRVVAVVLMANDVAGRGESGKAAARIPQFPTYRKDDVQ